MRWRSFLFTVALALGVLANVSSQTGFHPRPTWQDMIAKEIVPYRQLTVDDFRIDDKAHPKINFYIQAIISPKLKPLVKADGAFYHASIDEWMIFSGFTREGTSRKSRFKQMQASLPYAQALLDLNEIHARRLAALKSGELPEARGDTIEDAQAKLKAEGNKFLAAKDKELKAEMAAFMKATGYNAKKKKVLESAADIRRRLDATPATTVPFILGPAPSPTPVVESLSTPSGSQTP